MCDTSGVSLTHFERASEIALKKTDEKLNSEEGN